ncbi:MAG: four helix bundle protein [Candidatus Peribacteraceae bacterium]
MTFSQKKNPLQEKSYAFALRIVKASTHLQQKKKEFTLTRQLLKSGTSIGANVEEAVHSQSRAEFVAKLQISIKEAFECGYWIRLMHDAGFFTAKEFISLSTDLAELQKLLTAIIKTTKSRK